MSSEWLEKSELSSHVIRLDTPSITMRCAYDFDRFDALYNPIVGINIMSEPFALKLFKNLILTPTTKVINTTTKIFNHGGQNRLTVAGEATAKDERPRLIC